MRARGPRGEPGGPQGALGTPSLALPWAPWPSWVPVFFRKTHISHLAVPLLEDQR